MLQYDVVGYNIDIVNKHLRNHVLFFYVFRPSWSLTRPPLQGVLFRGLHILRGSGKQAFLCFSPHRRYADKCWTCPSSSG